MYGIKFKKIHRNISKIKGGTLRGGPYLINIMIKGNLYPKNWSVSFTGKVLLDIFFMMVYIIEDNKTVDNYCSDKQIYVLVSWIIFTTFESISLSFD